MLDLKLRVVHEEYRYGKKTSFSYLHVIGFVVILLYAAQVSAAISVRVPDQNLIDQSVAIVIGQVLTIESYQNPNNGEILTHITLLVDEVLKGEIPSTELTIKQAGGSVQDQQAWIFGNPEFVIDEEILLFLTTNNDGTMRVAHLYQGKFSIHLDELTGKDWLSREVSPPGVTVLDAVGDSKSFRAAALDVHELEDFKTQIRDRVKKQPKVSQPLSRAPVLVPKAPLQAVSEIHNAFNFPFYSIARWFEPDEGLPVTMRMNLGNAPLDQTITANAIRAAYSAWSDVEGSSFRYEDGGGSTTTGGFLQDGVNAISFNDPLGQIDSPIGCAGILAVGGIFMDGGQSRRVNGQEFFRAVEGDVVFNEGFDGCGFFEDPEFVAAVTTHELGHALGFGHSFDPSSIMFPIVGFDKGAALGPEDMARLVFSYPNAAPSATPTQPILVSPSGTIHDVTPAYTWNPVNEASWYYLWVNDSSGNKIKTWYRAYETRCFTGLCSITPDTALEDGAARWWVQAWNENGYGPWSDAREFIIDRVDLAASPSRIAAGGRLQAAWEGMATPTPRDWIGLYAVAPGVVDTAFLAWRYTSGEAAGDVSFTLSSGLAPGNYELRLFADNGYTRLATSGFFTVVAPSLSVSSNNVPVGGTLQAIWESIAASTPQDWIGLYAVAPGVVDTAYMAWRYTSGEAAGSVSFTLPSGLAPGAYELRLFADNGYIRLATSDFFTVVEPSLMSVSPPRIPAGGKLQVASGGIDAPTPQDSSTSHVSK